MGGAGRACKCVQHPFTAFCKGPGSRHHSFNTSRIPASAHILAIAFPLSSSCLKKCGEKDEEVTEGNRELGVELP
jgi:hypothetical protein